MATEPVVTGSAVTSSWPFPLRPAWPWPGVSNVISLLRSW